MSLSKQEKSFVNKFMASHIEFVQVVSKSMYLALKILLQVLFDLYISLVRKRGIKMKIIFDTSVSITKFFRSNKEIINIKEKDFKEWIIANSFANKIDSKFIATQYAVENGYMINKRNLTIDLETFKVALNYSGYITPKGQKHILDLFENKEED